MPTLTRLKRHETGTRVSTLDFRFNYPIGLANARWTRKDKPRHLFEGFRLKIGPAAHMFVTFDGAVDPVLQVYDRKCDRLSRACM
jgi:hypothetical protein